MCYKIVKIYSLRYTRSIFVKTNITKAEILIWFFSSKQNSHPFFPIVQINLLSFILFMSTYKPVKLGSQGLTIFSKYSINGTKHMISRWRSQPTLTFKCTPMFPAFFNGSCCLAAEPTVVDRCIVWKKEKCIRMYVYTHRNEYKNIICIIKINILLEEANYS